MNKIPNRAAICQVLMEEAKKDKDIVVLCSDSRGSASLAPFAEQFPGQFVEVGIAEQDLVSISAGLAKCGKKAFAASPACFLTTRSYEQAKVDVCYSNTNVKLIGISGGVSYGALGMSHHSAQDIAAMSALPNMRIYLPSDRHQTRWLTKQLLQDTKPAYIRVGRNPVEDIYEEAAFQESGCGEAEKKTEVRVSCMTENRQTQESCKAEKNKEAENGYVLNKAIIPVEGTDAAIIACGEMIKPVLDAAALLRKKGICVRVIDMYCVKPLDKEAVLAAARECGRIVTVEEHSPYGGLGAMISQVTAAKCPVKVKSLSLPDAPVITGTSKEVFDHYGLNAEGISKAVEEILG